MMGASWCETGVPTMTVRRLLSQDHDMKVMKRVKALKTRLQGRASRDRERQRGNEETP
jgi:hypothetical protein